MNIAIVGAGMMGNTHGHAYQKLGERVHLAYVVEKDEEKRRTFEKEFGCKGVSRLEDIQAPLDLIDICLPTFAHTDTALTALQMCNYVLLEKPACLTQQDWARLCEAVRQPNKHMMIGQVLRYWNGYVKAKELVENGEIGKLQNIYCARQQKKPSWSKDNWLFQLDKSGGILFDLSIHDIDFVAWLLGKPSHVSCDITCDENQITLFSTLLMDYGSCSANITAAWGMPSGFNNGQLYAKLEITGDKGMLTYTGGNQLTLIKGDSRQIVQLDAYDGYEQEIEYFVSCIERQQSPSNADLLSVQNTMSILWAAAQASEKHDTIAL